MNHHEASWRNNESWWSSWWSLLIFVMLVRHDLPDSTCTSLMDRWPWLNPQCWAHPTRETSGSHLKLLKFAVLPTLVVDLFKILQDFPSWDLLSICNSSKFNILQNIYVCLSSAANIRFYSETGMTGQFLLEFYSLTWTSYPKQLHQSILHHCPNSTIPIYDSYTHWTGNKHVSVYENIIISF